MQSTLERVLLPKAKKFQSVSNEGVNQAKHSWVGEGKNPQNRGEIGKWYQVDMGINHVRFFTVVTCESRKVSFLSHSINRQRFFRVIANLKIDLITCSIISSLMAPEIRV